MEKWTETILFCKAESLFATGEKIEVENVEKNNKKKKTYRG